MIDLKTFVLTVVIAIMVGTLMFGLNRGFLNGYHLVRAGETYHAPQHGDINATQPMLVCRYLSLGGTRTRVLIQSEKRPDCPFWLEQ